MPSASPAPVPPPQSQPQPADSTPTATAPLSHRATKRSKTAHTPSSTQSDAVSALFAKPPPASSLTPSSAVSKSLPPPPEIVSNVQGSSAGAGSGEFHVYKAARRREYERVRMMEEDAKKEEMDAKWEVEKREREERDGRMSKSQRKRAKAKERKKGGKENGKEDMEVDENADPVEIKAGDAPVPKKKPLKLDKAKVPLANARDAENGDESGTNGNAEEAAVEEVGIVLHDDD